MDLIDKIDKYIHEQQSHKQNDAYMHFVSKNIDIQAIKKLITSEYNKVSDLFTQINATGPYDTIMKKFEFIFKLLTFIKKTDGMDSAYIEAEIWQNKKNNKKLDMSINIEVQYFITNSHIKTIKNDLDDEYLSDTDAMDKHMDALTDDLDNVLSNLFKRQNIDYNITQTGSGPHFSITIILQD